MSKAKRPAAFLDRDGVMVKNPRPRGEFILRPEALVLLPGAAEGARRLRDEGFFICLVTNQVIVGHGRLSRADLDAQHDRLRALLDAQGARLDAVYDATEETGPRADWVKPGPGMLLAAARDHGLDLSRSALFGDKAKDLQAAAAAGAAGVWVSGDAYPGEPEACRALAPAAEGNTLAEAAAAWLRTRRE
jgi:D-glycero-D-manno-heptose 1,7-bisphosphate phosphatase